MTKEGIATEVRNRLFWRDVGVEVIGTFLLLSVQCALVISWGDSAIDTSDIYRNIMHIKLAIGMGSLVTALAWTFGDFGGCHMNPAVTLSYVLARELSILKGKELSSDKFRIGLNTECT